MVEENTSQEFRVKNIDEIRIIYLIKMDQKNLISRKHKRSISQYLTTRQRTMVR